MGLAAPQQSCASTSTLRQSSEMLSRSRPFCGEVCAATIESEGISDNAFAMLVGAGIDIGLRKGIGLRLVQADWLMTKFADETQNKQGRVSAGIVIKF